MRIIEARRHAMRSKPGEHLSQAGVDLARRVGGELGPFNRVIASSLPRAVETAIAMGYAVDVIHDRLSTMGDDVSREIAWDAGFAAFARTVAQGGATARFARMQLDLWRAYAAALPENGRGLLVTHGGFIEAVLAAAMPAIVLARRDPPCDYCEGARLTLVDGAFRDFEILRVQPI